MHRAHLSRPLSKPHPGLRVSTARVRLIHEDPPKNNGQYMRFGVQEAYLRKYMQLLTIETMLTKGPGGKNFHDVMILYFTRTRRLRRTLDDELCAYWMTSNITVPRDGEESTLVPVITCVVVDRHRTLGFGFEPIVDELDRVESNWIHQLTMASTTICPPLGGNKNERAEAEELIATIHQGLSEGYHLSAHPVEYPHRGGN